MDSGEGQQTPDQIPVNERPAQPAAPQPPRSTANYADFMPPKKPKPQWLKWLAWLGVLIVVIALAFGAYKVFKKTPTTNAGQSQNQGASQSSTGQSQVSNKPISTTTTNYSSPNFNLSFNYPSDWTVADKGGGTMTVKSPSVTLTNANGQKINGQIILTFRNKNQKLPEFASGSAVAAMDSTIIAYTNPTQNQKANTYMSFLRYSTDASSTGMDGIYITGNAGYKSGQDVPTTDISGEDPIIDFSFGKCTDSACTNSTPVAIADSSWNDANFSKPLTNILESLVIN